LPEERKEEKREEEKREYIKEQGKGKQYVKGEGTYLEAIKVKTWVEFMPEAKRKMFENHPLMTDLMTLTFKTFLEALDESVMPSHIAKAMGERGAITCYSMLKNSSMKDGGNTMGKKMEANYKKDAAYIDAHQDVLPKLHSLGLTADQRRGTVERLEVWYDVAENSPPDEDDFLKENPGIIPMKVAELLTAEERKEAIEKLKAHKEENPAAPPDQDEDYSEYQVEHVEAILNHSQFTGPEDFLPEDLREGPTYLEQIPMVEVLDNIVPRQKRKLVNALYYKFGARFGLSKAAIKAGPFLKKYENLVPESWGQFIAHDKRRQLVEAIQQEEKGRKNREQITKWGKDQIKANLGKGIPEEVFYVMRNDVRHTLINLMNQHEEALACPLTDQEKEEIKDWIPVEIAQVMTPSERIDMLQAMKFHKRTYLPSETDEVGDESYLEILPKHVALDLVPFAKRRLVNTYYYLQKAFAREVSEEKQKFFDDHQHLVPKHIAEILSPGCNEKLINDILDLQKQGLFVKTEEDEEDFTNPECVPLKVVKLLPENMRRKIDKMIEDRKDRRKEEENGQGFDEEFVAANSEWVCRGACEWLTPAECRELVDNLKKHKENPSAYLNEKRNWAPDAWKKLKIKPGVKVRVSSRDHEMYGSVGVCGSTHRKFTTVDVTFEDGATKNIRIGQLDVVEESLENNGASFGTAGQYGGKHKMPDYEEKQEAKKLKIDEEEEAVKEEPEEMEAEDENEARMSKIQETEEKMKIITENRL